MLTHNPALWFLTCLFVVEMLFFVMRNGLKARYVVFIVMLCALLSYFNYQYFEIKLPWNIEVALTALSFYTAGYFLKQDLRNVKHRKALLIAVILFIAVGFLQSRNVRVDMRANEYGNMAIFYITSFLGTAGVIFASFKLQYAAPLQFLGKNSLVILVLHYPVIRALKAVVYYLMNVSLDETYGSVVWSGVYTAATLMIMVPCIFILNRYPVLLGRRRRC
ncbi:acyltransferase family protein [Bacillus glycinifermentans]|uniref:Acyltransferase n=1 Tax=Bacillus glycinifermentans TaxID=1664069 RepID=A0ABU6H7Y0_9BACI|nr:acyltransferase [Bacillus glycinifermentans]MEC0486111.1 acyltransferase [Bacillus glycinifermentans]MEC0494031.1 acyltransferase [Bacillus glycinifermentans]MEC0542188.1 acyltransferase [Bacillus glycinifermentans]